MSTLLDCSIVWSKLSNPSCAIRFTFRRIPLGKILTLYPPSAMGDIVPWLFFKDNLGIRLSTRVDMPLSKEINKNYTHTHTHTQRKKIVTEINNEMLMLTMTGWTFLCRGRNGQHFLTCASSLTFKKSLISTDCLSDKVKKKICLTSGESPQWNSSSAGLKPWSKQVQTHVAYHIHFWTNTLRKGRNSLILLRLNSITTVLLQGWLWH